MRRLLGEPLDDIWIAFFVGAIVASMRLTAIVGVVALGVAYYAVRWFCGWRRR